ncbi:DoxX family membrane protein [Actinomadura syzygii]|uniref:DoxX family membrane protein n=1 Tax=Actinomadura syzygii TaxID=1427538 RepID=A0A5D0TUE2_9ACTN|nr:DoxX family membrane protein [Actinomadura syzygii]TYC09808.1 DoxX family membrane protein [Actinomadura syzygii]
MSLETPLRPSSSLDSKHPARYALAAGRIFLGWTFLWAFVDKLFGLGKPTEKGWLDGVSPSKGFLSHTEGPFKDLFHAMAGKVWVDALFMFGLGGLGIALLLGICLRIAAAGGTLLLLMLAAASLWPDTNPFMDMHWIYAALLVAVALADNGTTLGLGRAWARLPIVRDYPVLR